MADPGGMAEKAIHQSLSQQTAREVSVMLSANTGPYQKEMQKASEATHNLADALHAVEKAYQGTLKFIGRGMIGLGASFQGAATGAVWAAAHFEEAFARVAKTTGLQNRLFGSTGRAPDFLATLGIGENDLQKFEDEVRRLSTQIPVGVRELAHLSDVAGQLGVSSENLVLFADTAAKLGAGISDLPSDVAIAGLANLIGAFGLAEEKVVNLGSSLAELSNHTRGSASDMIQFSERVAGTAVQIGMTAEEVLGLGAAVSAVGTRPELGASAIVQTMTVINRAVQGSGEELRKFAQVMGMTSDELERMWREDGATFVLVRLLETLNRQGEEAAVTLQQLGLSGVGTTQVLGGLAAQLGVVHDALNLSNEASREGQAVSELAAIRFNTLVKSLQLLGQSTAEVGRSLGIGFLEPFKLAIDAVTGLVNIFNKIPQPIKTTMGLLLGMGGVVLTLAGIFTLFFAKFHALFILIHAAPAVINALQGWLLKLGGVAGPRAAVQLEALARVFQRLSDFVANFGQNVRNLLPMLGDRLGGMIQRLAAIAMAGRDALVEFWQSTLGPRVAALGRGIMDQFATLLPRLAAGAALAKQALTSLAATGLRRLQEMLTSLLPLAQRVGAVFLTLGQVVRASLLALARQAQVALTAVMPQVANAMATLGSAIVQGIAGGLAGGARAIERFAVSLRALATLTVIPASQALRNMAITIGSTLQRGIQAATPWLREMSMALREVARWIIVDTIHTMGTALHVLGRGAQFATRALAPLALILGKFVLIPALIVGALIGIPRLMEAWNRRNEEAVGPLHALADATGLAVREIEQLEHAFTRLERPTPGEFSIASKDVVEDLKALDQASARKYLINYRFVLEQSGNDPQVVQHQIEELIRLSGHEIVFQYRVEDVTSQEVQEAIASQIEDLIGLQEGKVRQITGIDFLKSGDRRQFEASFEEQLNALLLLADETKNVAAVSAAMLEVRRGIDEALRQGEIDFSTYETMIRRLDEIGILPEFEVDKNWAQRNIQPIGDFLEREIVRSLDFVGVNVPNFVDFLPDWLVPEGYTFGIDVDTADLERALALIAEDESFLQTEEGERFREVIESVTGETDDLAGALRDLDDDQVQDLIGAFRDLSVELEKAPNLLGNFDTEFRRRMESGRLVARDDQELRRFWDAVIESFPQEVGFVRAIKEAQQELDLLVETGQGWGDEADRIRRAIQGWQEEFARLQVQDLEQALNVMPAREQVRFLLNELRQLENTPWNVEVRVNVQQMLQRAFAQEESDFRQVMSRYDNLIEQREKTVEAHNDRLGRMEEDRARSVRDAHANHRKRLEEINKAEKKALEERVEQQAKAFNLLERIQATPSVEVGALLHNMEAQNRAMQDMIGSVSQLRDMGLDNEVMKALGFDDPKNFAAARRLLESSLSDPGMIDAINAQWRRRLKLSESFVDEADVSDIKSGFDEQRRAAQEQLDETLRSINERHSRAVADAARNHEQQLQNISDQLAELGQDTFETLDELLDKAASSGLEKLMSWADEIRGLRDQIERALGGIQLPRNIEDFQRPVDYSQTDITLPDTRSAFEKMKSIGSTMAGHLTDGMRDKLGPGWIVVEARMRFLAAKTMGETSGEISRGVDAALEVLRGLSNQDRVWDDVIRAGIDGASRLGSGIVEALTGSTDDIQDAIEELEKKLKDLTKTTSGTSSPFATFKALGLSVGGEVPGEGTEDKVPALLTPGEFVQPVDAVKHYGVDFMEAVRARKFATGGPSTGPNFTRGREANTPTQTDLVGAFEKALMRAGVARREENTYGPITVQAQDPNEMQRKLESKRRIKRLTGGGEDR